MRTTIKIKGGSLLAKLFIMLACLACHSGEIAPNVENFTIYDVSIRAAVAMPEGYAILSDSVWFAVNASGKPSGYFPIPLTLEHDTVYASDILYANGRIFVLASVYSKAKKIIDLGIIQYSSQGDLIHQTRIRIADDFKVSDLQKVNSNYTISFPLYAKGLILSSSALVIAFNYIGKQGERWRYSLLHVDQELKLLNKADYQVRDFYGWLYKIKQVGEGQFVLTRGGNDWYAIDQFDLSLQVARPFVQIIPAEKGPGNPILTNVIPLADQRMLLTGHADQRNNPDRSIVTNYDFWAILYSSLTNSIEKEMLAGSATNKELCFDSYLTPSHTLLLAGSRRGYNQTTLDLSARIFAIETHLEGQKQEEFLITRVGGLEALFIYPRFPAGSKDIIGRKFGLNSGSTQTFFRTINDFTHE